MNEPSKAMMRALPLILVALFLGACANHQRGPSADDRYVILYTGGSRQADGIFPVQIYNIDGREILTDRISHRVHPGTHSIQARAIVDRSRVPGLSRDLSRESNAPLVENFQSGYRYFIGVRADSPRRADWELVIWKREPVEAGTIDLMD